MSFFQEMINEFKQEIEKEMAVFSTQPSTQSPRPKQAPASMGHTPANTGVRITDSTTAKKQRKKAPQKKSAPAAPRPQAQTQTQTQVEQRAQPHWQPVTTGRAHHLAANLNPQTARNAIIMAEIIGPPVSRRKLR